MEREKEWSKVKNTLVMFLNEEVSELQQGVVEMREDSLLKNVAKRKVLYNITGQGELQLVYALLALAQYYQGKGFIESSIRSLKEARDLKYIGDADYLLGTAFFKKNEKEEAMHWLEASLEEEWIEPSIQHRAASKLQAMTLLQQLYFQSGQRQKLLDLSYKKIELARQNSTKSENYFHALSLIDMALVHDAMGEKELALEKIDGAISLFENEVDQPQKLVQAWKKRAQLMLVLGKPELVPLNYIRACEVIKKHPGRISEQKQANILEAYIQSIILN